MYFSSKGLLVYPDITDQGNNILVSNIFKRVILREDLIPDSSNYYDYTITEGETPELIAEKLYGNPYYYWTIMFVNRLFDPVWDMPLSEDSFNKWIEEKYGSIQDAKNQSDQIEATYTQSGNIVTVDTSPVAHGFITGRKCRLDFEYGSKLNTVYSVTYITNTQFSVTVSTNTTTSGDVSVSPPYMLYFIRNNESDPDFYETDKETYDLISNEALRSKRSAYEEETILNNNKRIIKVIKKEYISEFVKQFTDVLR